MIRPAEYILGVTAFVSACSCKLPQGVYWVSTKMSHVIDEMNQFTGTATSQTQVR